MAGHRRRSMNVQLRPSGREGDGFPESLLCLTEVKAPLERSGRGMMRFDGGAHLRGVVGLLGFQAGSRSGVRMPSWMGVAARARQQTCRGARVRDTRSQAREPCLRLRLSRRLLPPQEWPWEGTEGCASLPPLLLRDLGRGSGGTKEEQGCA